MLGISNSYVASTLKKDFRVSFVIYIPNTPLGSKNVNFHRINKAKGRLGFPPKTKSPSGVTAEGIPPPPKKWSHFFAKKIAANVLSTPQPELRANLRGTRVARGQRSASRG
jgi:hypothetical protein